MLYGTILTLGVGGVLVTGLSSLLLELGKECRRCPVSGPAARVATLSALGAFASMGLGIVALIAAFAGQMRLGDLPTTLVATGGAAVALGIGFSIAATSLRDALLRVRQEARADKAEARATQEAAA